MLKRYFLVFIIAIICNITNILAQEKIIITVNQFINHAALDDAYEGISQALKERGILPDRAKLIVSNAQGNISNSVQISKYHASLKPKFMIAIATPAAQTNLKAIDIKHSILAFVAVTDPKAANLIRETGVIGISDNPPIKELLEITQKIIVGKKVMGVIYNSGEINSVQMVKNLEEEGAKLDFDIKKISINNSSDIKMAMQKLLHTVDIIYLPQDNTVVSAIDSIVSLSNKKIPLIANDPSLIEKGVFLALGTNYFKSGQQLGNMIADIIENKTISHSIIQSNTKELKINKSVAKDFEIIIPADLNIGD